MGYDPLKSNIWFIGIEEGGAKCIDEIRRRLQASYNNNTIDISNDMESVYSHIKAFDENSPIQPTWSKLIIILLTLLNKDPLNRNNILNYQCQYLACDNNIPHCLLEFFPLPSPSTNDKNWLYNKLQTKLFYLENKDIYYSVVKNHRIFLFQRAIEKYKPKIVIFYSTSKNNMTIWQEICNSIKNILSYTAKYIKNKTIEEALFHCNSNNTHFYALPHPGHPTPGLTNECWIKLAYKIQKTANFTF